MMSNLKNRKGAVMIEYGLMAVLIALALVAGITALSANIGGVFTRVGTALK